jgi:hypothetical protein
MSELPIEPVYSHYTVELRKGSPAEETVRHHEVKTVPEAEKLIEGLRDTANQRDGVSWQYEEVDVQGNLYGLAPGGVVYTINVVPPLSVALRA